MDMLYYSLEQFENDCHDLGKAIKFDQLGRNKQYTGIYPILRGGAPVALGISKHTGLKIIQEPIQDCLIVDDIIDSGATISRYEGFDSAVLHIRPNLARELYPTYYARVSDQWIHYWWEGEDQASSIEDNIARILQYIGEDVKRLGLIDTPARIAKMFREFFAGYHPDRAPRLTVFPNGEDGVNYDQMLKDEGYFFSYCEHHMVPFFGNYYFGYIPDKLILGASKIGKVVDYYAGRLQIAERLVHDVVNCIEEACHPKGMILVMKARHLCKEMRGLKKWDSPYEAIAVRGCFLENINNCKIEFMERLPK